MQQHVSSAPAGYHTVTPYLLVEGAARLLTFLEHTFGAAVVRRSDRPDGSIGHTEVRIGNSLVMLSDATAEWPVRTAALFVYVDDADAVYARALAAGATSVMPPADTFHGDRMGGVNDVCGNQWWVATQIEVLTEEALRAREAAQWKAD